MVLEGAVGSETVKEGACEEKMSIFGEFSLVG
jgi:hypothetical protein